MTTLQPVPELATHVHVSDRLPINAFGFGVPRIPKQCFTLPWLSSKSEKEKTLLYSKNGGTLKNKRAKFTSLKCSLTQKGIKNLNRNKAANKKLTQSLNGHVNGITSSQYPENAYAIT